MTSEMDAAMVGVNTPIKTESGDIIDLFPMGGALEMWIDDGMATLDLQAVRDLILALQQWLATKEGLG